MAGVVLGSFLVVASSNGETIFEPSVTGALGYEGRETTDRGGSGFLQGGIGLPLLIDAPTSSFRLDLRASYRRFVQEDFRDTLNLQLISSYAKALSPRDSFDVGLGITQFDRPTALPSDELDPTFVGDYRQRNATAWAGYSRALFPSFDFSTSVGFSTNNFDRSEADQPIQNREEFQFNAGASWARSQRDSLSPFYSYRFYRFEDFSDQESHSLGLGYGRRLGESSGFSASLGVWTLRLLDPLPGERSSRTGGLGSIAGATRLRSVRLSASLSHDLSAVNAFGTVGPLTRLVASVANAAPARRFDWAASLSWARQEEALNTERPDIDTVAVGASAARRLARRLALRASASWNRRIRPSDSQQSYWQIQIGVAWSPFGSLRFGPLGRLREEPDSAPIVPAPGPVVPSQQSLQP